MTAMDDPKSYDALSTLALVVGVYEGLLPFPAKLFDWSPVLSIPARLDAPAWWIVAGVVLIVAATSLDRLDKAKKARFGHDA